MKKLTIINHALSELGMEAVTTISDSNAAAILGIKLSVLMPILLQSALWKFAMKFKSDKTPMQSQISPKFQYSYYLPNNYGRFVRLASKFDCDFLIMDRFICSDNYPFEYYYMVNSVDYEAMPINFSYILGLYVASESAIAITRNVQLAQYLTSKFEKERTKAILTDDMERVISQSTRNSFDRMVFV
jgi:hypothetical protein